MTLPFRTSLRAVPRWIAGWSYIDPLRLSLIMSIGMLGCKDLTGSQPLPAGTTNPANYNTVAGALGERNAAIGAFQTMLPTFILDAGTLSDEIVCTGTVANGTCGNGIVSQDADGRNLPASSPTLTVPHQTDQDYTKLNYVRALASQARGQLAAYDPGASPVLRGELFALEGYAEILLADLFCSGIPLSTLNFQHDYTYHAASKTIDVYQDAVGKFDSALALSSDSLSILNLARVGKARALLDQGAYAVAAQIAAAVPSGFSYSMSMQWVSNTYFIGQQALNAADREGGKGMPFLSSQDPRSAVADFPDGPQNLPMTIAAKVVNALNGSGYAPVVLADGTEARLIQAEAALQAGDTTTWLAMLNNLRDSAIIPGTGQPAPQLLPHLTMPHTDTARVSLLFQERAEWLYFTGHRQGDLRRLIRQYHRSPDQVYPTGVYPGGGFYGSAVNAPIPGAEYANPLFHGCLDREA